MRHRDLGAAALLVVVGLGSLGCQRQAETALAATDATVLCAALDAYLDAANAGDAARWSSLYSEDAVMMPPNNPLVEGRAAIESWLSMLPVKITDAEGTALEERGAGNFAYVRGTYSMNLLIPGLPGPVSQQGKFLQIYGRQPSGSWLLARDIWNANAPPAGP
jgi:ketosteroid isomerase-like protein